MRFLPELTYDKGRTMHELSKFQCSFLIFHQVIFSPKLMIRYLEKVSFRSCKILKMIRCYLICSMPNVSRSKYFNFTENSRPYRNVYLLNYTWLRACALQRRKQNLAVLYWRKWRREKKVMSVIDVLKIAAMSGKLG